MEIFGIGLTELLFIAIIILIIFGPNDLVKNSKAIGKFLNNVLTSDAWRAMRQTTNEIRRIPTQLMREANLEALENELGSINQDLNDPSAPASAPGRKPASRYIPPQGTVNENRIAATAQPTVPTPEESDQPATNNNEKA